MGKQKTKSTITDLPNDILALVPVEEHNDVIKRIMLEAYAGEFHDYKNDKYVCGKVALANLLVDAKDERLMGIRQRVVEGYYDESPDAEDKAKMKKEWVEGGGTEQEYEKLFGK